MIVACSRLKRSFTPQDPLIGVGSHQKILDEPLLVPFLDPKVVVSLWFRAAVHIDSTHQPVRPEEEATDDHTQVQT
jgi:hypothetical protein